MSYVGLLRRYYCNAALGVTQWTHPGDSAGTTSSGSSSFMSSPAFTGPRAGYYFSTGPQGTGYYIDTPLSQRVNSSSSSSSAIVVGPRGGPLVEDWTGKILGSDKGGKKSRLEMIAERQAARNAGREIRGKGRGRGRDDELDPMDPVRNRFLMGWQMHPKTLKPSGLKSTSKRLMLMSLLFCLVHFCGQHKRAYQLSTGMPLVLFP